MATSLTEFLAQANRGMTQSVLGSEYLSKALSGTALGVDGGSSVTGDIFTATFGRKVWHALNNQTRFFNALPRNVWGNTAGWRVRSDRGASRSNPVTETGSLPTIDVSAIETVSSLPRIVGTTFAASVKAMFTSQLEGGVGDVLALENENAQIDHIKEMNLELLAGSTATITAIHGSTPTTNYTLTATNNFRAGDKIARSDNDALVDAGGKSITSIDSDGVVVSEALASAPVVAQDGVFTHSRAGLTSIDDIVSEDEVAFGISTVKTNAGVYDLQSTLTASRLTTTKQWATAASVQTGSGTGRDLSLNMLDTAIQKIRTNGGEPKLIVMGHDQYFKLERLLNSQQRYLGQEEYTVGVGSEKTFPGTRTGLILATYMGIPILPDADTTKSPKAGTVSGTHGSNVYILDTDYLEVAVAQPTQYIENRDYFAASSLVVRGLLYTMAELRAHRFDVHGKILDLNE